MAGFKKGRTLIVDRRDEPMLPWLLDQVDKGVLVSEFVQYDEQSSALKFWLRREGENHG